MILAALALTTASPSIAYTIDPRHRLVEGIASDGTNLWVSSILDRTIIRCAARCVDAFKLKGSSAPFGMAWDAQRGLLWIAMDCLPTKGAKPCKSELLGVSRAGRVMRRISPVADGHFGDVSVYKSAVIISDSKSGAVYWTDGRMWMTAVNADVGTSAQGTAISNRGYGLLVADYALGLFNVEFGLNRRTALPRQDGKPLKGIDGMVRAGGAYYAIYNGAAPGALLKLDVSADRLTYEEVETGKLLPDPTQLTVHGKALYIVADSGWTTVEKNLVRASGATIVRVPLP